MNAKHTPGPWKTSTTYVRKRSRQIEIVPWDQQDKLIARLSETTSNEETYANARLIAAAPELLAACQAALADYERYIPSATTIPDRLRLAIAKAEGSE